jgi:hypothetical protein
MILALKEIYGKQIKIHRLAGRDPPNARGGGWIFQNGLVPQRRRPGEPRDLIVLPRRKFPDFRRGFPII